MTRKALGIGIFFLLISCMFFPLAAAETETVTQSADFDEISATGVTDDTTTYVSTPSIKITKGTAHIEMKDFLTIELEFELYCAPGAKAMSVTIGEMDEEIKNYVIVVFAPQSNATHQWLKVTIGDKFGDELEQDTNEKRNCDVTGEWQKCRIDIRNSKEKANRRELEVTVGGVKFVEGFLLISEELSAEVEVRNWDQIEFRAEDEKRARYIDDVEVRTDVKTPYDIPWTIAVVVMVSLYVVVAYKVKLIPFGKGHRQKKIGGGGK